MLAKTFYKTLLKQSFLMPITVEFWDGEVEHYGAGEPQAKITIHEEISPTDIMADPSITLGEAYMDGIIEIDGSIQNLIYTAYESADSFMKGKKFGTKLPKMSHSKKHSKEDVHSHYDLGNDFYKLWLDKSMTYSCAYFETPEDSLETAQLNKVDHILKKLHMQPGETLLDIGCGWSTLIIRAAKEYQVKATGITLSQEQYDYIQAEVKKAGLEDYVTAKLMDYRDLKDITFDHIASVGMVEHVGKENLGLYFEDVDRLLADKGNALIHFISRQRADEKGGTNSWMNKYIFPGGYVPSVIESLTHMNENHLQVIDMESLRRHYQHTLEIWDSNFNGHLAEVRQMKDERFIRMWDLYLQACAASFESGNIDVIQYLMTKGVNNDLPMTRDYMYLNEK